LARIAAVFYEEWAGAKTKPPTALPENNLRAKAHYERREDFGPTRRWLELFHPRWLGRPFLRQEDGNGAEKVKMQALEEVAKDILQNKWITPEYTLLIVRMWAFVFCDRKLGAVVIQRR